MCQREGSLGRTFVAQTWVPEFLCSSEITLSQVLYYIFVILALLWLDKGHRKQEFPKVLSPVRLVYLVNNSASSKKGQLGKIFKAFSYPLCAQWPVYVLFKISLSVSMSLSLYLSLPLSLSLPHLLCLPVLLWHTHALRLLKTMKNIIMLS